MQQLYRIKLTAEKTVVLVDDILWAWYSHRYIPYILSYKPTLLPTTENLAIVNDPRVIQ